MRTDKDLDALENNEELEKEESLQEDSLEWLLDMEESEQEDSLFKVEGNDFHEEGLSEYEAQMASRPMTRGNTGGDDLANYVEEEIVISSDGANSDIYGSKDEGVADESSSEKSEQYMAVDFTRSDASAKRTGPSVDEGADVLGLASEDDIGETQLTIKRVKKEATKKTAKKTKAKKAKKSKKVEAKASPDVNTAEEQPMVTVTSSSQSVATAVGTDVSSSAPGKNDDSVNLDDLDNAPATSQVANPDDQAVANESADLGDILGGDSILDHFEDAQKNLDDAEFDEMLLSAESFSDDADMSFDDLAIEESDDILSLDTSDDVDIDFHKDFDHIGGLDRETADQLAAMVPAVMQELHDAVATRAQEINVAFDSLQVEAMLATDDAAAGDCVAQGFAPVAGVLTTTPAALNELAAEQAEMFYVRIRNTEQDNANWNSLFDAEFAPAVSAPEAESDLLGAEDDFDFDTAATASGDDVEGFGDDIFGDDFSAGLDDDFSAEAGELSADIDDAFSTLAETSDETDGEICGVDMEAFSSDLEEPVEEEKSTKGKKGSKKKAASKKGKAKKASKKADSSKEEAQAKDSGKVAVTAPTDASDLSWCIPENIKFSKSPSGGGDIFADFLDAFIEEGSAEIERLEDLVTEWEKEASNEEVYAEVTRRLHTVKGIAKGVGLQRFGTLIHNFETLLEGVERPEGEGEAAYFRMINVWLDAVVRGIEHVTERRIDIASELPGAKQVAAEVTEEAASPAQEQADKQSKERDKKADQQLADEGAKVLASQQSVRITSEKLDHLLNLASQSQQLCVRASQGTNRNKRSTAELQGRLSSVRTHIGKIADRALLSVSAQRGSTSSEMDALEMDQYSELQEAASILREGVEDLSDLIEVLSRQNIQVETLLKQQSSVISSISSSIQSARVVPVSRLMPGLRRIVRTVSTDLGKVVTFRVLNEVGALDRDHYSRLQVVLEHMVRNALDHGVESPEDRLSAGKPEAGRITIDVSKSGGDYVVKLTDDGRGIDPAAIRESAYKKGLDVDVDALTDEQALRLIFHKGFSTASQVSEISGRGVGMDIVLSELQQIGGGVNIESEVGAGTTFTVRIPSNVSVNGALMVTAADSSYAIPLNGLIAVEQVPADEYFAAVAANKNLTLFDMECEPSYLATLCERVPLPERTFWEAFVPVIIAGNGDRRMAIAIDNVEEALELVVRSLGSQFSNVPGLAGAATTSDGEAIIALDLNLLVESVGSDGAASVAVEKEEDTTLLALVVDDSRTQRMVATSQLDSVGVETVTAENGQVAIDLLNGTHRLPDVVLLDVEMPVKDGIETLREIRNSQRYGHLPVIMVTSRTGTKHRALAKDAGCNAYMGKPFNFPALVEQINVLTGQDLQLS